ncbi:MAG: stage IV sporulation protein A [Clostridiaceae bacterium]|jgi:stage IV sporulation protein A|nr:stage IV sporulation protein A [Clostridiaceae bacterium]
MYRHTEGGLAVENLYSVYNDIAQRTKGDIYFGVVGPVRTGKSTFIKKFMEALVVPNIKDPYDRERAIDETPQSASGRMIMTTEPKFVPNEAVTITLEDNISLKVRLVDCVGYMVKSAVGHMEDEMPRMVKTPWSEYEIPFEEAAAIGTRKVINEHSTIGVLITADGSFTQFSRNEYQEAEEKVLKEMKSSGKPFVILLNSAVPDSPETKQLAKELSERYSKTVIPVDCLNLNVQNINKIMNGILLDFPVSEICFNLPEWILSLDNDHWLRKEMMCAIKDSFMDRATVKLAYDAAEKLNNYEFLNKADINNMHMGTGELTMDIKPADGLFYRIVKEDTGLEIDGEQRLFAVLKELSNIRTEYLKVENALAEVRTKGYGVVTPKLEELTLEPPEIVRQGNRFGIKLRASAPSIHMIRADIETEIAPLVGSEKQSEELVNYLLKEFEGKPEKLWESNIFGKSLHELITEGLQNKLYKMPEDAQLKLQETLQKIINEGSGGLICIIL